MRAIPNFSSYVWKAFVKFIKHSKHLLRLCCWFRKEGRLKEKERLKTGICQLVWKLDSRYYDLKNILQHGWKFAKDRVAVVLTVSSHMGDRKIKGFSKFSKKCIWRKDMDDKFLVQQISQRSWWRFFFPPNLMCPPTFTCTEKEESHNQRTRNVISTTIRYGIY